jgi:toxin ParE1/3/4
MANYRLTNEAESDLIRIHQYGIRMFGMAQADKYFHNFFDYFELIAQRPLAFMSVDEISKGCRCCPCGSDSIYYTILEGTVEIIAIVGSQDLDNIFS